MHMIEVLSENAMADWSSETGDSSMDIKQEAAFDSVAAGVQAVNLQPGNTECLEAASGGEHLPCNKQALVENMLDQVACSDAHFRHQQRDEPDLTREEKISIATDLFTCKPDIFLSRFGKYLSQEHLRLFDSLRGDYMIDFYLEQIRNYQDESKNMLLKRNRRFEAMKKLVEEGEYFSEDQMKERNPLQYEQMIGQFLDDDEISDRIDKSDDSFSNLLLTQMHMQYLKSVYDKQKEVEDSQMEEEDDQSEDDTCHNDADDEDARPILCDAEKEVLRNEFLRNMQLRFLNGEDADFNYSDVDYNNEYDSVAIRDRDEEEKYFDNDDDDNDDDVIDDSVQCKQDVEDASSREQQSQRNDGVNDVNSDSTMQDSAV